MSVGVIVPTYSHFAYAHLAVESAARTPDATIIVVDDGSPDWPGERIVRGWLPPRVPFVIQRYDCNAGSLTRSWNAGLRIAREMGLTHAVCGNADLVFPNGWWEPIERLLAEYDFVGPVTNAPGHCGSQDVRKYLPDYDLSDDPDDIDQTQLDLTAVERSPVARGMMNGFCIAGRVEAFHLAGGFDPSIPMDGNEDDFFQRVSERGLRGAICPASFVFHYRSVARGLKGRKIEAGAVRLAGCTGCGG